MNIQWLPAPLNNTRRVTPLSAKDHLLSISTYFYYWYLWSEYGVGKLKCPSHHNNFFQFMLYCFPVPMNPQDKVLSHGPRISLVEAVTSYRDIKDGAVSSKCWEKTGRKSKLVKSKFAVIEISSTGLRKPQQDACWSICTYTAYTNSVFLKLTHSY